MRRSTVKSLAALALTGAGSALVLGFRTTDATVARTAIGTSPATTSGGTAVASPAATAATSTQTTSTSSQTTSTAATVAAATPQASSTGTVQYADGTYTGTAVSEPWGTFQVQAVVSGGKLTDVVLVSSPADNHSGRINSQAVPILTQSAIAAQSANIDMVSGATWTSRSYTTSLQAALDQAAAAQGAG